MWRVWKDVRRRICLISQTLVNYKCLMNTHVAPWRHCLFFVMSRYGNETLFTFFPTTSDIFSTLFRVIKKKVYEEMKIAFCERVFSGNLIFWNSCHDTSSSGANQNIWSLLIFPIFFFFLFNTKWKRKGDQDGSSSFCFKRAKIIEIASAIVRNLFSNGLNRTSVKSNVSRVILIILLLKI